MLTLTKSSDAKKQFSDLGVHLFCVDCYVIFWSAMIRLESGIFSESLEIAFIALCDDFVTIRLQSIMSSSHGAFIDDSSSHFLLCFVCSPFSSVDVCVVVYIIVELQYEHSYGFTYAVTSTNEIQVHRYYKYLLELTEIISETYVGTIPSRWGPQLFIASILQLSIVSTTNY
jgi:hypothetical protein